MPLINFLVLILNVLGGSNSGFYPCCCVKLYDCSTTSFPNKADVILCIGGETQYTKFVKIGYEGDNLLLMSPKDPASFYKRIQSKLGWGKNIKG